MAVSAATRKKQIHSSSYIAMASLSSRPLPPSEVSYSESEIRMLACILGRAIAIPGGQKAKKKLILNDLARIVRADDLAWILVEIRATQPPLLLDSLKICFRHKPFSLFQKFAALELPGATVNPPNANSTDFVLHTDAELGFSLTASKFHSATVRSTIALSRKSPAEPFSEREIAISTLVLGEIPWLHAQDFPPMSVPSAKDLPRRPATVLEFLLQGRSRKEIGDRLGIQPNTVHGYVRFLYAHYGVSSHSSLLQQCLHEGMRPTPRE